jgi:hypothetical protein
LRGLTGGAQFLHECVHRGCLRRQRPHHIIPGTSSSVGGLLGGGGSLARALCHGGRGGGSLSRSDGCRRRPGRLAFVHGSSTSRL